MHRNPDIDAMSNPSRRTLAWFITGAVAGFLLPFGAGTLTVYIMARILKGDTETAFWASILSGVPISLILLTIIGP